MKRFDITLKEIKAIRGYREPQGEPKYLDAEFDTEPHNPLSAKAQKYFKIGAGDLTIRAWIKAKGFQKCLKKESTCLLTVGNLVNDAWQKGVKFYWLRPL